MEKLRRAQENPPKPEESATKRDSNYTN